MNHNEFALCHSVKPVQGSKRSCNQEYNWQFHLNCKVSSRLLNSCGEGANNGPTLQPLAFCAQEPQESVLF